jgi:uncharacterized Tic20 family protein
MPPMVVRTRCFPVGKQSMAEGEQTIEGPDGTRIVSPDERTWALVAHVGGLLTSFIAPLVIWLAKGDDSEFVRDQAKEALNFQITLLIASVVGATTTVCLGLGFLVLAAVWIADVVLSLVAALRSYDGHRYRYPATLRLI